MEKDARLRQMAEARRRAEGGDHNIGAQYEIISALERKGLDATRACELLAKLISTAGAEMRHLLNQLDRV